MPNRKKTDALRRSPAFGLAVLSIVYAINTLDRNLFIVLQESIRIELSLTDAELGLLTGMSFAIVYSVAALPIAWLADRIARKRIIGISIIIWSSMTAISGLATSFASMAVMRMGVAAGEAGNVPAAQSMIADYYPVNRRAFAYTIFLVSSSGGTMLGFVLGGWLSGIMGWRMTMILIGVVGLLISPLIFWVKEPDRGALDVRDDGAIKLTLRQSLNVILMLPTMRFLLAGAAVHSFVLYSIVNWSAPFYIRQFSMDLERVAFYLSIVLGLGHFLGIIIAGVIIRWIGRNDLSWQMRLPAVADIILIPVLSAQLLVSNPYFSLTLGFAGSILISMYGVCTVMTVQAVVPANVRASAAAILAFTCSVGGLAIGPPAVGIVSDYLNSEYGTASESLKYALLMTIAAVPIAGYLFFRATWHLSRFLDEVKLRSDDPITPLGLKAGAAGGAMT